MKKYTTVQGDMWDSIAHKTLGDSNYSAKLMVMNHEYLRYYIFPAGITLRLPETDTPVSDTLPPWKRVNGN